MDDQKRKELINGDDSNLALALLYMDDLDLDVYDKIMMVNHWSKLGSPPMFEPRLIANIGYDFDDYMNPFLMKLYNMEISDILKNQSDLDSLRNNSYDKIIEMIFLKKLSDLENYRSKSGYKTLIEELKFNETTKSLVMSISSLDRKYELLNFSATVSGYKFTPSIVLFGRDDLSSDILSEKSVDSLKGLIYHMTESSDWDKSYMPKALRYLEFKNHLLNRLVKSIISKYYTKEFESKFDLAEEKSDTLNSLFSGDSYGDDEEEDEY